MNFTATDEMCHRFVQNLVPQKSPIKLEFEEIEPNCLRFTYFADASDIVEFETWCREHDIAYVRLGLAGVLGGACDQADAVMMQMRWAELS